MEGSQSVPLPNTLGYFKQKATETHSLQSEFSSLNSSVWKQTINFPLRRASFSQPHPKNSLFSWKTRAKIQDKFAQTGLTQPFTSSLVFLVSSCSVLSLESYTYFVENPGLSASLLLLRVFISFLWISIYIPVKIVYLVFLFGIVFVYFMVLRIKARVSFFLLFILLWV